MRIVVIAAALLLTSVSVRAGFSFKPAVEISATDAYADEIHSAADTAPTVGAGDATFVVSRRCGTVQNLRVNYAINGTASNGVDYLRLSGSVIIPAGRQTARIVIRAINDLFIDPDETVVITLRPGSGYTLGPRTKAKAFIMDSGAPLDGGGFVSPGLWPWFFFPQ